MPRSSLLNNSFSPPRRGRIKEGVRSIREHVTVTAQHPHLNLPPSEAVSQSVENAAIVILNEVKNLMHSYVTQHRFFGLSRLRMALRHSLSRGKKNSKTRSEN